MGDNQQKWGYAGDNNHNNPMMVGIQKKMTFRKNFSIRSNGMTSNSLGRDWSLRGESKNKSVLAGSFNPSPNITDGCWQCKMYIFNNIQIIIDYNIYIYNYVCMYVCIYIYVSLLYPNYSGWFPETWPWFQWHHNVRSWSNSSRITVRYPLVT